MIKESDLIGQIATLSINVVRLMLIRQYDQTGRIDVRVFQGAISASRPRGGFRWSATPECAWHENFWSSTLYGYNKSLIFTLYSNDISVFPTR